MSALLAAVLAVPWLLAAAMFLTGIAMWRDWRVLAAEGVDASGVVEACEFESMESQKAIFRSRRGFYSCDYRYQPDPSGERYRGHFQSSREWQAGEPIPIRYRRDRPSASATLQHLANPSVVPGALIALPLAFVAWHLRRPLRRVLRRARPKPSS